MKINIKNINKYSSRLFCFVFIPLWVWQFTESAVPIYQVKSDGIIVGYVSDKNVVNDAYGKLKKEMNIEYKDVEFPKTDIEYEKINDNNINLSSSDEIRSNLKNSLKIKVKAYKITLNNNEAGIIASKDIGKDILMDVGKYYVDKNKITSENLISVDINTKSDYKEVSTEFSNVLSKEDAVKKIVQINDKNPVVEVVIKTREKEVEETPQDTIILSSDKLYLGDMKVVKGSMGKASFEKEVTYINQKKKDAKVIKEDVLVNSVNNVIYKGNKNPITDGVAFLQRPSRGIITSPYGARWGEVHHGVDIAANYGDPVGAALDGIVVEAGYNDIYGNTLILSHGNGIQTVYGHSSKLLVRVGDEIKKGQIIALAGSTGRSTGPHVHFELRNNGIAINPISYIK
ncbi:M23 family metallopeptidase [Inconstantimicrobium mannanitabidum]|uniref:Uncharacterized protein n=1 Tax=Inconstantimicrobium mannanitabidum TaxID=1604901 RepID=A0ACB5RHB5_9CLOT|nr:M23 family metallopeptidase [Clostridium sp. TW13]GKX68472.1 hypothetical protein rsdtw13_37300 [Clostridium sp. TW13]